MTPRLYAKQKKLQLKLARRYRHGQIHTKKSKNSGDPLRSKTLKVMGVLIILLTIIFAALTTSSLSVIAQQTKQIPAPNEPFEKNQDLTSYIYDRNGIVLYKIHGDQNREIIDLEEIPLPVLWAFIAAEDIDFYKHQGIDIGGISKAALYELFKYGNPRGGSTITQQMIKNTVLSSERSYERKFKEILLSLQIEQQYDKNDVLQLYLNEIGFGGNTYGIQTAAKVYFGKRVSELTLGEAAFLAGLPPAPGIYSPLFAANIEEARTLSQKSQQRVLDQMEIHLEEINRYAHEYNDWPQDSPLLTSDMVEKARKQKLQFQSRAIEIHAPHFVFFVEQELQHGNYNNGKPFTLAEIERGGLHITTTLDLKKQEVAEDVIKKGVDNVVKTHGGQNAALVSMTPSNGEVLAMVGSKNYFGEKFPENCVLGTNCLFEPNVNVTVALRQPGSSIKPFVYYTGFENGTLYPAYPLLDTKIDFGGGYEPRNNSGTYKNAPISIRNALRESLNVPAVEALEIIGLNNFIRHLQAFGYTSFSDPKNFGPSIALGAGEVSLLEHTNAFGVFANNGVYTPAKTILKITDKDGEVIYDASQDNTRKGNTVADERAVYLINDMTKYYHYYPSDPRYEFSGKTGTSDNNTNTYYMGWSPEIVTGIWVGNNDNSRMYPSAYGYTTARLLWIDFTERILSSIKPTPFPRPNGIVTATVCSDNGMLSTGNCPTTTDLFIEAMLPRPDNASQRINTCEYIQIKNSSEHKRVCKNGWYRYITAPKPAWQKYWDRALLYNAR